MADNNIILLVGLGNPGSEYKNHRHNVGFMVMDGLQSFYASNKKWKDKFSAQYCDTSIDGQKVILCKPQTFMNRSGLAVSQLMQFYKINSDNLIVFHDDIDLNFGQIKIKKGGGHGGHNGLRDIDKSIGNNYQRVRMGVGHPRHLTPPRDVSHYVLSDFDGDEASKITEIINKMVKNCQYIIKNDMVNFLEHIK